jgi:sec-independent protein translocase protein TatC
MSAEMTMSEHVNELRSRTIRIVISLVVLTFFSMTFGLKPLEFNSGQLLLCYPFPDVFHNIVTQLTSYMEKILLPPEVKLIQTSPGQAFFAQVYVSVLIGIIGSISTIVKEIFGFISPAIGKQTKKIGMIKVKYFLLQYVYLSLALYSPTL